MAFGELTADEQPEPGPRLRAEVGIVDAVEALEDLLLLVPWNADAVVLDDETGAAIVCHGQLYPRAVGGVGQRVIDQVIDHSRHLLAATVDRDGFIGFYIDDLRLEKAGPGFRPSNRQVGQFPKIK